MSAHVVTCRDCQGECVFDRAGPFPGKGEEHSYAVAWRCPKCAKNWLDVCPLGPLVPLPSLCINCGADYAAEGDGVSCSACGAARGAMLAVLGVDAVPDDPLAAAKDAFQRGLLRRGLAILNLNLQREMGVTEAWSLKCSFLDSMGYVRTKCTMLEAALAAGGPASLWMNYGFALQELNRHADAVAAYTRFRELSPSDPWVAVVCSNQANSLMRLGEMDAAGELYRQALVLEPERISHSRNFIRFLIETRRLQEALPLIETTLERATEDADLIALLEDHTAILAELENPTTALNSIDAALALGSDSTRTHFLRGRVLGLLGRLDEARLEIFRVLALDPNNAAGKEALETIDSVLIWGRMRRPSDPS
jgi:tetratricopeptide (TPR) repeat protein